MMPMTMGGRLTNEGVLPGKTTNQLKRPARHL